MTLCCVTWCQLLSFFNMAPYPDLEPAQATSSPLGPDSKPPGNPKVWIIPAVVGGGVLVTALFVWAVLAIKQRRKLKNARDTDPYLPRPDFSKRRKMSAAERVEEEEKQRIIMIRKSLASRSWGTESDTSRRDSRTSHNSQARQPIPEDPEEDEPAKLKEDWKAWEAQIQRSATLEQHPAAVEEAQKLAKPRPSRSRSPHSRNPLLDQSPGTPPRSPRLSPTNLEQT